MVGNKQVKVAMITKEWPPHIYGGAGVHVANLVSALEQIPEISAEVHCYGPTRTGAIGHQLAEELNQINPAFQALLLGEEISRCLAEVDVAHSHTWYANFAGHLAPSVKLILIMMKIVPRHPCRVHRPSTIKNYLHLPGESVHRARGTERLG